MKDDVFEKMIEYRKRFNDSFPTARLMSLDDDELIKMMDDCLKKNKDVFELGYIEHSDY